MTDYNKLKVPELRAELKKRGLPQTGLKATLVAALTAADNGEGSESEATVQEDIPKLDTSSAASLDTVSPILPSPKAAANVPDAHNASTIEPPPAEDAPESAIIKKEDEPQQAEIDSKDATSTESNDNHISPLASLETQEAIEDRLKRKERSHTPPVLEFDVARKRARLSNDPDDAETGNQIVTSEKDANWIEKHNGVDEGTINAAAEEVVPADKGVESSPTIVDTTMEEVTVEPVVEMEDVETELPKEEGTNGKQREDPSRFKKLFSEPNQDIEMGDAYFPEENERNISPAMHPATSALYIADIMRPLNPAQLKQHIQHLAAPPGQEPDADIILSFYIDSIRTHAFVSFTSISAASRVRSALHSRIWPDEKTRKPLWIDFVPVEKIEDWVEQEKDNMSGARTLGKKWEVAYDMDEDRRVTTVLREVSSNTRKQSLQQKPGFPVSSPQKPPTQPRNLEIQAPRPQVQLQASSIVATADGPTSLDELFKSTTALPKIYFQPVSKEIANKRLDNIDKAMSKDATAGLPLDGPINRYTFEDTDMLVDRGPEIFPGIRPPPGHRVPRGGQSFRGESSRGGDRNGCNDRSSYGGGRGGYGGDRRVDRGGYAQRRDSYRGGGLPDRGYDSYRGDRRGSRDYGRR